MTRRFLLLALLASAALPAAPAVADDDDRDAGRPNVVVIMTDDQDFRSMPVLPKTRHLIADRGTTFDQTVVNFPLCCPSRATFYTGQYAHNHGVLWNNFPPGWLPQARRLADAPGLAAALGLPHDPHRQVPQRVRRA